MLFFVDNSCCLCRQQLLGYATAIARQEWVVWGAVRCWTALCTCVPLCPCDGCPLAHAPSEERASSMSLPLAGAWGCSGTPCAAGSFGPAGETRLLMGRGGRSHAGARHLLENCGFRGVAGCVSTQWRDACVCAGMPSRLKCLQDPFRARFRTDRLRMSNERGGDGGRLCVVVCSRLLTLPRRILLLRSR